MELVRSYASCPNLVGGAVMNAWESPGSGNRRSKGSPRCCGRTGARQLPALRRIMGTGALRQWNDGRDVGNLGEVVWHYQRHDRRPMGHSRGSKGPRRQYGVCLACVWRVPGIIGGRGWHDKKGGAPPIKVDTPETKHLSLPVPFDHCLDQGAHHRIVTVL